MSPAGAREARIAGVLCAVVRQALDDAGLDTIFVAGDGTPEAELLTRWLTRELGAGCVAAASGPAALVADAANKTTLLLEPVARTAAILPLGDVYASQVRELAGNCSLAGPAQELARRCGLEALDAALERCVEGRRAPPAAFAGLAAAADDALAAWRRARFARARLGLVPKLAGRTIGIDLLT